MATRIHGPRRWSMTRDQDGYREYTLVIRVIGTDEDGPATALQTPGLPLPGSRWQLANDIDMWVWCRPNAKVDPVVTDENNEMFDITFTFSNKPNQGKDQPKCHDQQIEDPLLQPQQISGNFTTKQVEQAYDRFGATITNSAWELIRGSQVEFDESMPVVKIKQNVALLQLDLLTAMNNTLNAYPLWGLPARYIRLKVGEWQEKYYGQCYKYFTRELEFLVDLHHDRDILDEGTKALHGENRDGAWQLTDVAPGIPPNRFNPQHFVKYQDSNGNVTKCILDGRGKPLNVASNKKFPINHTNLAWAAGTATVTLEAGHGLVMGSSVTISGITTLTAATATGYNGTFTVASSTATTITFPMPVNPGGFDPHTEEKSSSGQMTSMSIVTSRPGKIHVEKYGESDFLLLGIPTTLGL